MRSYEQSQRQEAIRRMHAAMRGTDADRKAEIRAAFKYPKALRSELNKLRERLDNQRIKYAELYAKAAERKEAERRRAEQEKQAEQRRAEQEEADRRAHQEAKAVERHATLVDYFTPATGDSYDRVATPARWWIYYTRGKRLPGSSYVAIPRYYRRAWEDACYPTETHWLEQISTEEQIEYNSYHQAGIDYLREFDPSLSTFQDDEMSWRLPEAYSVLQQGINETCGGILPPELFPAFVEDDHRLLPDDCEQLRTFVEICEEQDPVQKLERVRSFMTEHTITPWQRSWWNEFELSKFYEQARRAEQAQTASAQAPGPVDESLLHRLQTTVDSAGNCSCWLYFKRWTLPDGTAWYKVGITNNPARRDVEQNVLPVPAETLACVLVGSMDRARGLEAAVHQTLVDQRIRDSGNRELFHLTEAQAAAVKAVIEGLC